MESPMFLLADAGRSWLRLTDLTATSSGSFFRSGGNPTLQIPDGTILPHHSGCPTRMVMEQKILLSPMAATHLLRPMTRTGPPAACWYWAAVREIFWHR